MKRRLRAYIIALTALFMASCAAFFSVTGVGKLASGAGLAAILLVTALEVGKLVVASFVHRRWKQINIFHKTFATFGVIIAMALTSIGIFGQLIGGYTATSAEYQTQSAEIALKESEKESLNDKVTRFEDQIGRKVTRADNLAGLREQQEAQKDSLENRKSWYSAKQARILIKETNLEINELNSDIDSLNNEISIVMTEINSVDSSIVVMNSLLATGEAAPLKMIADMLGIEMDTTTKAFFGFFVLIFDPFAIMLVIFYNIEMAAARKEDEEKEAEPKPKLTPEPEPEPEDPPVIDDSLKIQEVPKYDPMNVPEDYYLGQRRSEYEVKDEPEAQPEPVVYSNGEDGEFQKIEAVDLDLESEVDVDIEVDLEEIETGVMPSQPLVVTLENKQDVYRELLRLLFSDGNVQKGGLIYTFPDFMMTIENAGTPIQEIDVLKFLEFCVDNVIIEVDSRTRRALVSYQDALVIVDTKV